MKTDIQQTQQTDLDGKVDDFQVSSIQTRGVQQDSDTVWDNDFFTKYYGYYRTIPELKSAINAFATWILGKGFMTDAATDIRLDNIKGMGEDSFQAILWNMIVMKKINGDAYAEIIRNDEGTLINLKPLDPQSMSTVVNKKGIITKYIQRTKTGNKKGTQEFKPEKIFHLMNDRVADEIRGISVIEAVQWVIDARNEAMRDWRRISHRASVRILYVEEDDKTRLTNLKTDYAEAINNGELLILPVKDNEAKFEDLTLPPVEAFLSWIRYLENFFYQALGIPKVILGGSEEFTEASSKISYLTYEQIYTREIVELEHDIWNQLALKLEFNRPASLKGEVLSGEDKNTGQVGFQPNDVQANSGEDAL